MARQRTRLNCTSVSQAISHSCCSSPLRSNFHSSACAKHLVLSGAETRQQAGGPSQGRRQSGASPQVSFTLGGQCVEFRTSTIAAAGASSSIPAWLHSM